MPIHLDRIYTPLSAKGKGKEAAWPQRVSGMYDWNVMQALQRFAPDHAAYIARCKRACALSDWINGVAVEAIESTFSINSVFAAFNYGDIRSIADTTRFHFRSARQIVSLLLATTLAFEEEVDTLLLQLEVGIPADTLDLLNLPIPLPRGDYLALRAAGIKTRQELWQNPRERIQDLLGNVTATRLDLLRPTSAEAETLALAASEETLQ